jgi:anthranilate synthase component 2
MYYFIDFDDSFSNNILCEFFAQGITVNKIHWKDLESSIIFEKIPTDSRIILGPGPGKPERYSSIFSAINFFIKNDYKMFGICLGHQLICKCLGMTCEYALEIKHGQVESIELDNKWREIFSIDQSKIEVQRYNSLAIKNSDIDADKLIYNDEVIAISTDHILSMQFHPESIGTIHRSDFFRNMS